MNASTICSAAVCGSSSAKTASLWHGRGAAGGFRGGETGERVCDMGTGTGVLPLLLSARAEGTTFDAFEVQPDVADMARRSVALNGLEERIRVHCADCREAARSSGMKPCSSS
ncbi:MAG: methyltransferase [Christensenellales bacterium]